MTPKLRTHCATTLAALVLALPVTVYAYAEGSPARAGASRGEDGGERGPRATGGGDDRSDGPRRDDSAGPAAAHRYGAVGDAGTRSGSPGRREGARYGDGAAMGDRSGRHPGGGVHGRSRGQAADPAAAGPGPGPPAPGHGSPAHGAPAAPRTTGGAAAGPGPARQGDRPAAAARRPGEPHTPPLRQSAERPTPSPSPSPSPSLSASLAGRQAGQGRLRPGRTADPSVGSPASPDRPGDGREVHDGGRYEVRDGGHDGRRDEVRDHDREPDGSAAPRDGEEGGFRPLPDAPATPRSASADAPSPAAAGESDPYPVPRPLERQAPSLTLGAGCALMGLGLGYIGLRLRRR
ncbi:hypothetical protein DDQ41_16410 [Streptomyces spongiicola]|uniref:Uncharacterized protein n=1 Tax=Streptomyces spongiicola TaxID=1690221 RepID=A0ABM6V8I7_9ACTN|nr:hypothetical protein [Streptomyces spongiicola]AWK10220.1 hypothetical protein DDQ41_16410 [Streptomyces spongiicola]